MDFARGAVVDIGTNSVKLLVADVRDGAVSPVHETSHQTRLGLGLYEGRMLQPEAIAETVKCVCKYVAEAQSRSASRVRVLATSAMREARNAGELQQAVLDRCGLAIEVISGDQEAELAYRGAATDPALAGRSVLLLDMGGGSTEMVIGSKGRMLFRHSFALGTLRLMSQFKLKENPTREDLLHARQTLRRYLKKEVHPLLHPGMTQVAEFSKSPMLLVGTGGTATILGRMEAQLRDYDREKIEQVRISLEKMRLHTERLWSAPIDERRNIPGLPANRADVILPGIVTFEGIMEEFGFDELRVSTRGLRFAALLESMV